MNERARQIQRPRCFLLYAIAPKGLPAGEANQIINDFIGDPGLPLAICHDYFIGQAGGLVIFFMENVKERKALLNQKLLDGWQVDIKPLIFSRSPSAFDEQTTFTLKAYHGQDWELLQKERRPS